MLGGRYIISGTDDGLDILCSHLNTKHHQACISWYKVKCSSTSKRLPNRMLDEILLLINEGCFVEGDDIVQIIAVVSGTTNAISDSSSSIARDLSNCLIELPTELLQRRSIAW
jgi:hypothetical protein